jgi:hypothetical protein
MSAYTELRDTGQLGQEGVRLLYETVQRVARRFPPPQGGSWDSDKHTEAAHDFLTGRAENPITALFLLAVDDESFKSLLYTAVLNHFRSVARQSERGKLLRRINTVLREDPRFVIAGDPSRLPRRWVLGELSNRDEYTGSPAALRKAAWEAPGVEVARWRSATRTYISDRDSIVAFAEAVLRAASGPLGIDLLLEVAAHRFDLNEPPLVIDIDDTPAVAADAEEPDEVGIQAEAVWSQLTEQERLALPYIDGTVREAAQALDMGKTKAAAVLRRLKALLVDTVQDDGGLVLRLQELAMARTRPADRPSV